MSNFNNNRNEFSNNATTNVNAVTPSLFNRTKDLGAEVAKATVKTVKEKPLETGLLFGAGILAVKAGKWAFGKAFEFAKNKFSDDDEEEVVVKKKKSSKKTTTKKTVVVKDDDDEDEDNE